MTPRGRDPHRARPRWAPWVQVAAVRAVAGLAAAALGLAGCAGGGPSVQDIQQRGYLAVGTSGDYPPFAFAGDGGRPDGLEPALAELIARELGVEARVRVMPVNDLWSALAGGDVDIAVAGLDPHGIGHGAALFTQPYLAGGTALVGRAAGQGEEGPDRSPAPGSTPLTLAGRVAGVLLATDLADAAQREGAAAVRRYPDVPSLLRGLRAGEVEVLLLPRGIAEVAARRLGGLVVEPRPGERGAVAIAVRLGNHRLRQALDDVLAALAEDGRLDELVVRWFGIR